jgi:hypothetical protein
MKKAKVTKVTKLDKKDSYGNTTFIVEFANSDKGYYTSKNEDQKKFVVSQEAEYIIEEKVGKTGMSYFKITTPQSDKPFMGGGKKQVDPHVQMIGFAMAYTKDLIVAGKVPIDGLEKQFDVMYKIMASKI